MRYKRYLLACILVLCRFGYADSDVLTKAPSRFATMKGTPGIKVHYKFIPAQQDEMRPALVFVHGWCCDLSVWKDQAVAFGGKAALIFIDLPGYGKSDHPRVDYTMDLFAKGIDAVLGDAKVKNVTLVGHSMGVPVVRQYYRRYPGKTKGLILVDGALRFMAKDSAEAQKWASRLKEETFKEDGAKMLAGMIPAENVALREHIQKLVENTTPQVAISSQHGMIDESTWKEDQIDVPTQAIMAQSRFWTEDYKEFVKKLVPNIDYREFEGVGHFLFMEKPTEINAAMMEFLRKNKLM
jgi:pimeloyl-ACP methyl ester carboxylesterase